MFEKINEKLSTYDKAIRKLVQVTDKHEDMLNTVLESTVLQHLINDLTDNRIDKLESTTKRIDDMEEYIDALTKRVKELERRCK